MWTVFCAYLSSVYLTPSPSPPWPQPLTDRYKNAPGVYYKVFWKRHEIDPEIDYNEKTLEEYGNIGQYVVSIQRTYFYSQYKVKVQVSTTDAEAGTGRGVDQLILFDFWQWYASPLHIYIFILHISYICTR